MILVEDLEPDHYEVYEIRTPTGYVGDDTHYDVELVEGKTAELTVKNSKKPGLFIEKIDADSGMRLPGAVFRVSSRSSGEYVDVTTEENGAVSGTEYCRGQRHQRSHLDVYGVHRPAVLHPVQDRQFGKIRI